MANLIRAWCDKNFSHPDAIKIIVLITSFFLVIFFVGSFLTPVAISIILAYLLDGIIQKLYQFKVPKILSTCIVSCAAVGIVLVISLVLLPALWDQMAKLVQDIPDLISKGKVFVISFFEKYPEYSYTEIIESIFTNFNKEITAFSQFIITFSLASIPNIIILGIYLIMIPLLVLFFLIDKDKIIKAMKNYFSENSQLIKIGHEINSKLGSYVRGKVIEMGIVALVASVTFVILGLEYALLLGCLVGISVFIPFVGAIFVTIPIIIIGLLQWGADSQFLWLCILYSIILFLDANVLVPFLFSGAMKMHPLTIIIAILLFGGLWGVWGVFFAIPLAVIIKSVLYMWPTIDGTSK